MIRGKEKEKIAVFMYLQTTVVHTVLEVLNVDHDLAGPKPPFSTLRDLVIASISFGLMAQFLRGQKSWDLGHFFGPP